MLRIPSIHLGKRMALKRALYWSIATCALYCFCAVKAQEKPGTQRGAHAEPIAAHGGEKVLPKPSAPGAAAVALPKPIAQEQPLPPKVRSSDEGLPQVTIRRSKGMTVEEYRRNGQVYMVVFKPTRGLSYTYMDTDADGRLEGDPRMGPVRPVYYTLYEWQ